MTAPLPHLQPTETDRGFAHEPGQLIYRSLDGQSWHWPGPDPWQPDEMTDLDLFNLWAMCHRTVRKVEKELAKRKLIPLTAVDDD